MSITVENKKECIQLTAMIKGDIFKFKFNHEYTVAEAIEEVKTNIFI